MAGILSAIGNYVSEMLSPAFTPPRVEVPVDQDDPRYSQSFTVDQVDDYKKVINEMHVIKVISLCRAIHGNKL